MCQLQQVPHQRKKYTLKQVWSGSRERFLNFKPLKYLNLASGSTTASPVPRVKNFLRKGCGLGHVVVFGMKPRSLNFANASTMVSATLGVCWVCCRSCDQCLNFNPFIISGWMRWGWWGEAVGLPTTMLCRIHSLFLNALIFSQNAILWHGVAGMSWHITLSPNTIQLCKIPTVTPYGGVPVGPLLFSVSGSRPRDHVHGWNYHSRSLTGSPPTEPQNSSFVVRLGSEPTTWLG